MGKTSKIRKWLIMLGILILLALGFTIDDITGFGQVLDPLEFLAMTVIGFIIAKYGGK